MNEPFFKKIDSLNKLSQRLITEEDGASVIKSFTEESIDTLGADCGFAWGKLNHEDKNRLIYKSPSMECDPVLPVTEKRNIPAKKKNVLFDANIKKENYRTNISKHLKSYLLIPICYGDHAYGNIVLGYKKPHNFTEEELSLASTIGNNVSQLITINWLIENERKARAIAEKQKEIEALFAQEKIKTEFIADATHELRTPLAIIRGNIDLAMLEGAKDSKSLIKTFKSINHEIEHLSELLSDLAMATSGNNTSYRITKPEKVGLNGLLRHVADSCQKIAYEKSVSIKIKNMPKIDINGDKVYLEKMFRNLVKNAITYGKQKGLVEISGTRAKNLAKITVKDNGLGIAKKDLPHIFRRFFKAENSKKENKGGVGLGLSIVQKVAEEHGGSITVRSALGKGSAFTVTLPISKS